MDGRQQIKVAKGAKDPKGAGLYSTDALLRTTTPGTLPPTHKQTAGKQIVAQLVLSLTHETKDS